MATVKRGNVGRSLCNGTGSICLALVLVWLRVKLVSSLPSHKCHRVASFDLRGCERTCECCREVAFWLNASETKSTLDVTRLENWRVQSGQWLGRSRGRTNPIGQRVLWHCCLRVIRTFAATEEEWT